MNGNWPSFVTIVVFMLCFYLKVLEWNYKTNFFLLLVDIVFFYVLLFCHTAEDTIQFSESETELEVRKVPPNTGLLKQSKLQYP